MTIRLVLADDHPVVLAGLKQLLVLEADFTILASCIRGDQVLPAVSAHHPDVLVLDLQMPGKNGMAVLRELHGKGLPTRVVILTAALEEDDVLEAVRLGVRGLVLKDMAPHLLVECIREVAAGRECLDHRSLSQALASLIRRNADVKAAASLLSPRELEIARLVAAGLRNKEIAHKVAITEGTVKIHLHKVYQKLKVDSRVALTLWAQRKGLL